MNDELISGECEVTLPYGSIVVARWRWLDIGGTGPVVCYAGDPEAKRRDDDICELAEPGTSMDPHYLHSADCGLKSRSENFNSGEAG